MGRNLYAEKRHASPRIAVLGPKGTYSDLAVSKFLKNSKKIYCRTIPEIFKNVKRRRTGFGFAPFLNNISGIIPETIDCLLKYQPKICKKFIMKISHSLSVPRKTRKQNIKHIYSHFQCFLQCKNYLKKNFKSSGWKFTKSTSEAFNKVKSRKICDSAVIGPPETAKKMGFKIIARNISDKKQNKTIFILFCRLETQSKLNLDSI